MAKWRFIPLLFAFAAACLAFASEPGSTAREVSVAVVYFAFAMFLFLFATRHRVEYGQRDPGAQPSAESANRRRGAA